MNLTRSLKTLPAIFFIFQFFSLSEFVHAQHLSGFAGSYAGYTMEQTSRLIMGQNRVRLNMNQESGDARLYLSGDIQHFFMRNTDSTFYRLREAYIDVYLKSADIRIGRQLISWGRADASFITDILSPVDASEFLTQDFTDLRYGVTALNLSVFMGNHTIQAVFSPTYQPNQIPRAASPWLYNPFVGGTIPVRFSFQPTGNALFRDAGLALRYGYRSTGRFEVDLMLYYWKHPGTIFDKQFILAGANSRLELNEEYAQSLMLGYSTSYRLTQNWLLVSDGLFVERKRLDALSANLQGVSFTNLNLATILNNINDIVSLNAQRFVTERNWVNLMIGQQIQWQGFTLSNQWMAEFIPNYTPEILQEQLFISTSVRIQKDWWRDRLSTRLLSIAQLNGGDVWIHPEIVYIPIDGLHIASGAHVFLGELPRQTWPHLSYAAYKNNSFLFLRCRYFW